MTTITAGNLSMTGHCWSTQGSIIILHGYKIMFDCGTILKNMYGKVLGCKNICITHGHADHIGRLHSVPMLRQLNDMDGASYMMPGCCTSPWLESYCNLSELNGGARRLPQGSEIIDVTTHPIQKIGKELFIHALPTIHRVPSVGYALIQTRHKLKKEYLGLPGKEIAKLRLTTEITDVKETVLFAYTGDTTLDGVLQHPKFLDSEVLVTECTFIDDEVDEETAIERGHVHLRQLFRHQDRFRGVLVLTHFSPRYSQKQIEDAVYSLQWNVKPLLLL